MARASTRPRSPAQPRPETAGRICVAAIVLVVALQAGVLVRAPFLPFVDMPQHLALASILHARDDADVRELYETTLFPQVNILGLLLTTPLIGSLGETNTVRLVVVLYIVGLAWGLQRLTRALGGASWNVILALLLTVNLNVWCGFLSFCLGVPLLLLALAQAAARIRSRVFAVDACVWVLLALAHVLLFGFGLVATALWWLFAPLSRGERFRRLVSVTPALLLVLAWAVSARLLPFASSGPGFTYTWDDAGTKLADVGWSLIAASADTRFEWVVMGSLALLCTGLLLHETTGRAPRADRGSASAAAAVWESRMRRWIRATALVALLCYIALPYSIAHREFTTQGLFLLHHRFLVLGPLLWITTLLWPTSKNTRGAIVSLALLLHVALGLHWNELLARVGAQARGLDGAVEAIPPRQKVKSLIYAPYPVGLRFGAFLHVASLYQARKLGEVDQSFALLPTTPVHYRDPRRPYLSQRDENLAPTRFDWKQAGLYDYLLLYDPRGRYRRFYARVPHRMTYSHNGWMVLRVEHAP